MLFPSLLHDLFSLYGPSHLTKASPNAIKLTTQQSFIVSQLLLCLLPLLIFLTFSLSTIVFVLGVAAVFALFWIGVALLILVPALVFTSSIAVLVWGWVVGSFVIARWLYMHSPVGVQNGEVVKKENGN
jgi:ABC-type nickel/cobalt efflux system permease component RcnA